MYFSSSHIPPFLRRLLKYLASVMTGFLVLLGLGFLLFHFNKDQIKQSLLRYVQEHQHGEIHIREIQFSPLSHLPYIALRLDEVCYYEHLSGDRPEGEAPILEVDHAYLGLNLLSLFRGRYDIREISLSEGQINLLFYPDNSVNLLRALGVGQVRSERMNNKASSAPDIDLLLNELRLKNLKTTVVHQRRNIKTEIDIGALSAGLHYRQGVDDVRLEAGLEFAYLKLNDKTYLREKVMQLDLDFTFDEQTLISRIHKSRLVFEGLAFDMSGTYDFRESGLADLHLDASDEDLTLLSYLIEDDILNRNLDLLHEGNAYLRGRIRGKTINHLPEVAFRFGAENINLEIPGQEESIEQLGFSGYFTTGKADDFSGMVLEIDRLRGRLPGGHISADLEVVNLLNPLVTGSCRLTADIQNWDKVFKLGALRRLSGRVALHADLRNRKLFRPDELLSGTEAFQLEIMDAGFRLPGYAHRFEQVNALAVNRENKIAIENFSLRHGGSEYAVKGAVGNLLSFLLHPTSGLQAELYVDLRRLSLEEYPRLKAVAARMPDGRIPRLNFDLSLNTRVNRSPTTPPLQVKNLRAFYRGSLIDGHFGLRDFRDPVVSGRVSLKKMTLSGWEKLFGKAAVDSLSGEASLSFEVSEWKISGGFQPKKIKRYQLDLKDAQFHLPVFPYRFRHIAGSLSGFGDQLKTDQLNFRYADSRLSVQGDLRNLLTRLGGRDSLWQGRLQLIADSARFNEWPFFDTLSAPIAREQVRDLFLDLEVVGRGKWRKVFPWASEKRIAVRNLRGDFRMIPDIHALKGQVVLSPKGKRGATIHINQIRGTTPFGKIKLQEGQVSAKRGVILADTQVALGEFQAAPFFQGMAGKRVTSTVHSFLDAGFQLRGRYHLPSRKIKNLDLTGGGAEYRYGKGRKLVMQDIDLQVKEGIFSKHVLTYPWLEELSAGLSVGQFHTDRTGEMSLQIEAAGKADYYFLKGSLYQRSEVLEEGTIEVDLSGEEPVIHLAYQLENIPVESVIGNFQRESLLSGPIDIVLDLTTHGSESEQWLQHADGGLRITGNNLLLHGLDLDRRLERFRQKEPFPLAKLGAYFIAGPFGAAVTGGRDVVETFGLRSVEGKTTPVAHFISDWEFSEGSVQTVDAGLVTEKNRLAMDACINLRADSIEQLTVSVIDVRGCSLLKQTISGNLSGPHLGKVEINNLLPGLSTEVVGLLPGWPCEEVYSGSLLPPVKEE